MADTYNGSKIYICATPQANDLNQAAFEALTWVEVLSVGQMPEMGAQANIINYPTVTDTVVGKGKGLTDAGTGTLECAYDYDDSGQGELETAGATNFKFAIKHELTDAPSGSFSNTIIYSRAVITGPRFSGGGAEDFVRAIYTLGFVQSPIKVNPAAL